MAVERLTVRVPPQESLAETVYSLQSVDAQSLRPLQSEDIAAAIVFAVTQPPRVDINEMLIRPTDQQR